MDWLEITIDTGGKSVEEAAAALTAQGFSELVLEDQGELEAFLEENRSQWDYIDEALQKQLQGLSRIRLYLDAADTAALARLSAVAEEMDMAVTAKPLAEEQWEQSGMEHYPPQEVGDTLVVLPVWLAESYAGGRKPILLDPGIAFGTGYHPSTQMVLEEMERRVKPGDACLDLGSGSGILSIAALRLGAGSAVGVDIDPKAEKAARENAALNGFAAPEFTAVTGNITEDEALMSRLCAREYDVVLVNIVADVIIRLAPVLPKLAGETVICSGILDTRLPEVTAALERAGLQITETLAKEEWRCVCARRRTE
ncbi:MAG TPA: 50S ribosomal protein L11 methyltransferase [Candidatus Faecousia intestinigallinarum]|nr:50S ribosomal protein L11 methyltransferase [Candidatus Faecousia intestinigallinarum]